MSSLVKGQFVCKVQNGSVTYALYPKEVRTLEEVRHELMEIQQKLAEKKRHLQQELAREKAMVLAQAQEEAEGIVAAAKAAADEIRETAREEGFSAGYAEGFAQGQAKAQELIDQAQRVLDAAVADRRRKMEELEPQLIGLLCELAGKLVSYQAKFDDDVLAGIIEGVLAAAEQARQITLRVHPHRVALTRELTAQLPYEVTVLGDDTLGLADCYLESDIGEYDGRLISQVERLKQRLIETA